MARKVVDPERLKEIAAKVSARLTAENVAHALIGGLAVAAKGYVRATSDVDFLIAQEDLARLTGRAMAIGMTEKVEGIDVDFIVIEDFEEPTLGPKIFGRRGEPIPIEALIYLKLKAGRKRDHGDVVELIKRGRVPEDKVRAFLRECGDEDLVADFDLRVLEADNEED